MKCVERICIKTAHRKVVVVIGTVVYVMMAVVALLVYLSYARAKVTDLKVSGAQTYQTTTPAGTTTVIVHFPSAGPEYLHVNVSAPALGINETFTMEFRDGGYGPGSYRYVDRLDLPTFPHFQFENPGGAPLSFSISVEPGGWGVNYPYVFRTVYNYHTNGACWTGSSIMSMFFGVTYLTIFAMLYTRKNPTPRPEIRRYSWKLVLLLLWTIALAVINFYNFYFVSTIPYWFG